LSLLPAIAYNGTGTLGRLDVLVNGAGGNMPSATLNPGRSFFDLPVEGLDQVIALNLHGTLLPSQVFGEAMASNGHGCIVNISSMAVQRAMTHVLGYGLAKAAVENATHWLAIELAHSFGAGLRVNAIAVDLSGSSDPRAPELERRIVLSQYLTAINSAGSMPPQETGRVCNSWHGKFHLEMHWWHAAHFALWGCPQLLERSLPWYSSITGCPGSSVPARLSRGALAQAGWP